MVLPQQGQLPATKDELPAKLMAALPELARPRKVTVPTKPLPETVPVVPRAIVTTPSELPFVAVISNALPHPFSSSGSGSSIG